MQWGFIYHLPSSPSLSLSRSFRLPPLSLLRLCTISYIVKRVYVFFLTSHCLLLHTWGICHGQKLQMIKLQIYNEKLTVQLLLCSFELVEVDRRPSRLFCLSCKSCLNLTESNSPTFCQFPDCASLFSCEYLHAHISLKDSHTQCLSYIHRTFATTV